MAEKFACIMKKHDLVFTSQEDEKIMIQPRQLASKALMEVVREHEGEAITPEVEETIKGETLLRLKEFGVDLLAHADRIKVNFIRADLPNLDVPEEYLQGIQIH